MVYLLHPELMNAIREDVSILTFLAEVLCLLDMLVNSFANTISMKPVDKYTRPQFSGKCSHTLHGGWSLPKVNNTNDNGMLKHLF